MKFALIIWVCSFIPGNACMKPITYPRVFDSWYECSRTAHVESVKIITKLGYAYVNKHQVGTKYSCRMEKSI